MSAALPLKEYWLMRCRFYKRIDEAYTFANKKLLDLLRDDQNLISRLK